MLVETAIIVLWLELSPDKATGLHTVFTSLGALMLITLPLVFLIPDAASDRRRTAARASLDEPPRAPASSGAREPLAATTAPQPEV